MTTRRASLDEYGTALLLATALLSGGAKSPLSFCLWALLALGLALITLWTRLPDARTLGYFLVFIGGVALSQIYSLDPTNSLFWTTQSLVFACLWLALQASPAESDPEPLWKTLQLLGGLTAAVSTFQWVTLRPMYGVLPINPNFNAAWMAALAAAILSKSRASLFEKLLGVWLSALIVFGQSRSGLLALLVGACYGATRRMSWSWVLTGLSVAGIVALVIPHAWFFDRMNILENGGRLRIWQVAWKGFQERPLLGWGLGNFELIYLRHAFPVEGNVRYAFTTAFAHNDYLQAFSELGWPTAGILLFGFCRVLTRRPSRYSLARPAKAILLSLGTAAIFNPIFKMPILIYLALLAASCLRPSALSLSRSSPIPKNSIRIGFLSLMSLLGILLVWGGVRASWGLERKWDSILQWNPHDAEAWHELARYSERSDQTLFCERKAVEESPFDPYYREGLGRSLESLPGTGTVREALETYMSAICLAPTRAVNFLAIARLLYRSGEAGPALGWAEQACVLEPNYWEATFWKARCLEALGHRQEAIFVFKDLARRHHEFQEMTPTAPRSPYEEAILHYEDKAVQDELARAASSVVNGVQ